MPAFSTRAWISTCGNFICTHPTGQFPQIYIDRWDYKAKYMCDSGYPTAQKWFNRILPFLTLFVLVEKRLHTWSINVIHLTISPKKCITESERVSSEQMCSDRHKNNIHHIFCNCSKYFILKNPQPTGPNIFGIYIYDRNHRYYLTWPNHWWKGFFKTVAHF